jgi:hypothetical protein
MLLGWDKKWSLIERDNAHVPGLASEMVVNREE